MAPELVVSGFAVCVDLAKLCHLKFPDELVVEHVAERTVTKVMAQTCDRYVSDFGRGYLEFRLVFCQELHLLFGKVTGAYAVFGSFVSAAREHLVAEAELLEALEPFELRGVDDAPVDWLEAENAVDRVADLPKGFGRREDLLRHLQLGSLRANHF